MGLVILALVRKATWKAKEAQIEKKMRFWWATQLAGNQME